MACRSIQERLAQLEARKKALTVRLNEQKRAQARLRKVFLGAFLLHRLGNPANPTSDSTSSMNLFDWLRTALPGLPCGERSHHLFDGNLNSAAKNANNDQECA